MNKIIAIVAAVLAAIGASVIGMITYNKRYNKNS